MLAKDIKYPSTGDRPPYHPTDHAEDRLRGYMSPYLAIIEHAIYQRLPEEQAVTFHAEVTAAIGTGKDLRKTACEFLRRQLREGDGGGIAPFGWTDESRVIAKQVAGDLQYVPWLGERWADPDPEWVIMVCAVSIAYNGIFRAYDAVVRDNLLDRATAPTESAVPSLAVYEAAYHTIRTWTPGSTIRHMATNFLRAITDSPPADGFTPHRLWWNWDCDIILPEDIRAARSVTITGWVSGQGGFYHDEATAREKGATHEYCRDCAKIIHKTYDHLCNDCRTNREIAQYATLPIQVTDDCVYSQAKDAYYDDVQQAWESLEPGETLAGMRLMVCEPEMADTLSTDRWIGDLGPDIEAPHALEDAVAALNMVITGGKTTDKDGKEEEVPPLGPLCWYPKGIAADISDFPTMASAEDED